MDNLKSIAGHYLVHLIPVWTVAGLFSYMREDLLILIAASMFAIIIDVDHFVDYWLNPNRSHFSVKEALSCDYFATAPKIYLPFHSYDLHLLIAALLYWSGLPNWALAWGVGFIVHIVTDEILGHSPGTNPFRNFFVYRFINRFDGRLYYDETA